MEKDYTIKELYEWALKHNVENSPIVLQEENTYSYSTIEKIKIEDWGLMGGIVIVLETDCYC